MTRLLCLGDSYTIGEGVSPGETWPALIAARHVADLQVIAVTGWTIADLLTGMDDAEPIPPADLVTVLIGVNDQYDDVPVSDVLADLDRVFERATTLARGRTERVISISIPDWSVTPFASDRDPKAIAGAIDAYNAAITTLAEGRGHPTVDVTGLSRTMGDVVGDDGLHPSGAAYRRWADEVIDPAIKLALASTDI